MTQWSGKPRWEVLEDWLIESEATEFTAHTLAAALGCDVGEASALINSHLGAQRGARSRTLFVIKRRGRTRSAVWSAGERTVDVRALNATVFDDIRVKVGQAWQPDVERIAALNPRTARRVALTLDSVLNGALVMMANALDGAADESSP